MRSYPAHADLIDDDDEPEQTGTTRVYAPQDAPVILVQAAAYGALSDAKGYRDPRTLTQEGYEFAPYGPVYGKDGDGAPCWIWDWNRSA